MKQIVFSKKAGKAEWAALILYAVLLFVVTRFHEYHFDEIQAWEIAKEVPFRDILLKVEHYEGHPPLWHLLLAIFAKTGLPFQTMLPLINITICTGAIAVLLFASPFPKLIRCLLPFTYYLFYQYGVLSRPYSILMLAIMLAAAGYSRRNQHPWRYILPLCLLCLSSAYGLIIAGMLCLVWTGEILMELKGQPKPLSFLCSARFFSLVCILLLAVAVCLIIRPADDCYYNGKLTNPSLSECLTNASYWERWLLLPFEIWFGCLFCGDSRFITENGLLIESAGGAFMLAAACIILRHNRKLLIGLLPYLAVSGFMVFGYFSAYHLGILILLHIFTGWIVLADTPALPDFLKNPKLQTPLVRKCLIVPVAFCSLIPVIFTGAACIQEIRLPYSPVQLWDFIKENHLEDKKILCAWEVLYEDENGKLFKNLEFPYQTHYMPAAHPDVRYHLTDVNGNGMLISAYAERNIFLNYNTTCPEDLYMHYRWQEDTSSVLNTWKQQGLPDLILDYAPIDTVYGDLLTEDTKYVCIEEFSTYIICKLGAKENTNRVFLRKDLLEQYPQFSALYP